MKKGKMSKYGGSEKKTTQAFLLQHFNKPSLTTRSEAPAGVLLLNLCLSFFPPFSSLFCSRDFCGEDSPG